MTGPAVVGSPLVGYLQCGYAPNLEAAGCGLDLQPMLHRSEFKGDPAAWLAEAYLAALTEHLVIIHDVEESRAKAGAASRLPEIERLSRRNARYVR